MERRTVRNSIIFAKRKMKRGLATLMAILLVITATDISRMQYVRAEGESMANVITAFDTLSESITNQQLTAGASEAEINLPSSLSVTSELYYIDTAHAVSGDPITVTGSAISVDTTYSLTMSQISTVL